MKNNDANFMVIFNIKIVKKSNMKMWTASIRLLRLIRYDPSCVLYNLDNMSFFGSKLYRLQSEMMFIFIYFLNYLNIDDCW